MIFLCSGCGFPAFQTLCSACRDSFYWNRNILSSSHREIEGIAPLLYSFERTQRIIRRWKEHGGSSLEVRLFRMPPELGARLRDLDFFCIVPIPQSRKRTLRRGRESALVTARHFSDHLEIPVLPLLDLRVSDPVRQTGRTRFEREFSSNPFSLSGVLNWDSEVLRKLGERVDQGCEVRILLIDDLITSGNTLAKAAATLREWLPRIRCWAGALGYRPRPQHGPEARWHPAPESSHPVKSPPPAQNREEQSRNEAPDDPAPRSTPRHPKTG